MTARRGRDALATWVHGQLLAAPPRGLRRRCLLGLRTGLVAHGDPAVHFELAGMRLVMPLSHDLPHLRVQFPLYSDNLARLAAAIVTKYPDLAAVDIGANVGDSLALIRSVSHGPVLCVEGDARYLGFLRANTASLSGVSIAPVFVGATTGELPASIASGRGTARLKVVSDNDGAGPSVPAVSLESILAEWPLEGRIKLVKSDTDGFEGLILMSAVEVLKEHRPVLFFEYDPHLLAENGTDGLQLLAALRAAGYCRALLYDNVGDLVLATRLDEREHLEEISGYVDGRGSERYLDIAAFHTDDIDMFELFRAQELDFFRTVRRANAP